MKRPRQRKLRSKSRFIVRPNREVSKAAKKPNAGQFKGGNTAALRHGLYSGRARQALLAGQEARLAVLPEERKAIFEDLGGVEHASVLKQKAVNRALELEVIADTLLTNLIREGVLTAKGQSRAALSAYLSVADRLLRLYQMLGLERRAKRVPSIEDFIRERQQEKGQES